ncbi:MAG: adenylate/guanylate cyclase domain-containing protein [Cyanobacteria bacterium SBLK]|nr:adenylate/guanylate cyclase domain-containing protein [Cyanobacteria bacterium SBLK]
MNAQKFRYWGQRLQRLVTGSPQIDTTDYRTWQHRFFIRRLHFVLCLALFLYLPFTLPRLIYDTLLRQPLPEWWYVDIYVQLGLIISLIGLRSPWGRRHPNLSFFGISGSINIIEQIVETAMGGNEFDLFDDFFGWMLTFFIQSTLIPVRWRLHLISQIVTYCTYFGIKLSLQQSFVPSLWTPLGWVLSLFIMAFVATLSVYFYEQTTKTEFIARTEREIAYQKLEKEQAKLAAEQERSEKLLRNILPDSIACRLKHESQTIADSFSNVTVLFADIVGFTELSARISARELVELLNQIFSRFDRLAEKHGLEKIKTIGDAYMVVSGLPEEREDRASAMADMALDMQFALKQFNQHSQYNLNLRIGIHTGDVVAGVIGLKKFAYDLWGDTVNTASRMESHGIPGHIQISEITHQYLQNQYLFQERGTISVKGKGEMKTYLLIGKNERQQDEIN